jgi:hypothetical protein
MRLHHALAVALVWAFCAASGVMAHTTSTGLATLAIDGSELSWSITLTLAELESDAARLIERAADGDQPSAAKLAQQLKERVRFAAEDEACRPGRVRIQGSRLGDGRVTLQMAFSCPRAPGKLEVTDELTQLFGPHYRTIASLARPDGTREERVFDDQRSSALLDLARPPGDWAGFFALGVEHILTGWDHLLFLAALLVGSRGFWRVLGIVTAFTVAHSVTLSLAALGLVTLPAALVEPAIAASIVWIAAENLFAPGASARRWAVGFAFGLVHGFGFASALTEIGLAGWPLARALIGFNLGVEVGQAAAVVVVAPLFAWIAARHYAPRFARGFSALVALAGAFWFVERLL